MEQKNIEIGSPEFRELNRVFKLVCRDNEPKRDWRAPIAVIVPTTTVLEVQEAIGYFTGTSCVEKTLGDGKSLVASEGYRNGPCGP